MIELATETVVSLTQATNHLPRRRGGKKPHASTLYRWAKNGLETIRVGGTLCTSVEALQRFCERLTAGEQSDQQPSVAADKAAQQARDLKKRRLDAEIGT